jgi:hypothetical protein
MSGSIPDATKVQLPVALAQVLQTPVQMLSQQIPSMQ